MKSAIVIGSSIVVLLAQDALPGPGTGWEWVIQGGALAILGFDVICNKIKTIPAIEKRHTDERNQFWDRMERLEDARREEAKAYRTAIENVTKTLEKMQAFCQQRPQQAG